MEPKAELQRIIYDLIDFIADIAPEVQVKQETVIYEDEHANLSAYPPLHWNEEQYSTLRDTIYERVSDLHYETGYLILVSILEPEQQVAEAARHLQEARAAVKAAETILAEAQQIGIWQPKPTTSEAIPA